MQFGLDDEPKRKNFSIKIKKIEWMKSGGHKPELFTEKGIFYKTSKCRNCPRKLIWGDRTYDFDHKDNNSRNNSQKNCYLVCKVCHGRHTVIKKRKVIGLMGEVIGHETIKKKVGYKKPKAKKKKRVPAEYDIFGDVVRWKYVTAKPKKKAIKKKKTIKKKTKKRKTKKKTSKKKTKPKAKKTTKKRKTKKKAPKKKTTKRKTRTRKKR